MTPTKNLPSVTREGKSYVTTMGGIKCHFVQLTLLVLPVCSLHVHMKAIAHANNWSLTLAFHIFLPGYRPGYVRV